MELMPSVIISYEMIVRVRLGLESCNCLSGNSDETD